MNIANLKKLVSCVAIVLATTVFGGSLWEGEGTQESPFLIQNADDLGGLQQYVSEGNSTEGAYFKLVNNIAISEFEGVGDSSAVNSPKKFAGVFDGNDKAITVNSLAMHKYAGVFNSIGGTKEFPAVIKDLTVNFAMTAEDRGQGVAVVGSTYGYVELSGITTTGAIYASHNAAALVVTAHAKTECLTITNCHNSATVETTYTKAAGFIAICQASTGDKTVVIGGCSNTGDMIARASTPDGTALFVGYVTQGSKLTIKDCTASGACTSEADIGSLIGNLNNGTATIVGTVKVPANMPTIGGFRKMSISGCSFATVDDGVATLCATPTTVGSYKVMFESAEDIALDENVGTLALDTSLASFTGSVALAEGVADRILTDNGDGTWTVAAVERESHEVRVPKTVSGVYVPVVTDVTAGVELEEVEEENYEYYVYRVPDGTSVSVDIVTPYSNVVDIQGETHFETNVMDDVEFPLPTGYAAGFLGLKTRGEYVHEIWYDENWVSPTDDAMPYPPPVPVAGYCSAVHNGNFVGRNLDYFVNDMPTFVVHVAGIEGERFASVGIGSAQLHNADVAEYTAEYSLPPLGIFDGINENGVVIEENVVPFDVSGDLSKGTNPGKSDLHIVYVPRYVLDHATSAAHAIELLEERNLVGDLLGAYSFHYLIADKDESYVVEFINNKLVWRKMDISTNFNLCWNNGEKSVITDETEGAWTKKDYPAPYDEETSIKEIEKFYTPHAMGVERFITLREHYDEGNTLEGMRNLMKRVQYSQTYSTETAEENYTKGPSWWVSESCSDSADYPLYVDEEETEKLPREIGKLYAAFKDNYEAFSEIIDAYDMAWGREVLENVDDFRYDYTGIWYTTHTAVYDIENRSLNLCVQEDYETPYDFKVTRSGHVEAAGLTVNEGGQVVYKATASSMPTKTYQLKRTQDLTTPIASWEPVATVKADDAEIMLLDPNPPERQAFYTVVEKEEK